MAVDFLLFCSSGHSGFSHPLCPVGTRLTGPVVVTMVPSRELVQQVEQEFLSWRPSDQYGCCALMGGGLRRKQTRKAKSSFLVATPARLADFIQDKSVDVSHVTFFIIDEVDHMLHLGQSLQVAAVSAQIRPDRQTVMFCATLMKEVRDVASQVLHRPLKITINQVSTGLANHNVEQHIVYAGDECHKPSKLRGIVQEIKGAGHEITRMMIFCGSPEHAWLLADFLRKDYSGVLAYGSKLSQDERNQNIKAFREDPHAIMVCTNLAARGLDIKDVAFVLNYDLPWRIEKYVHRIGRSGRAGAKGVAYSLFNPSTDWRIVRQLIRCLNESGGSVAPPWLYEYAKSEWGNTMRKEWRTKK